MEFLCAARFSKFCPYFRPKNFIFLRPALQYIISSLLILEHKQKRFLNPFQIPIFLFLFYLFGIEPINTLIHSRKFLQNHTRFQTKMGKVYTHFQTLGEAPIWLIQESTPWVLFFKALSSHSSSKRLESWQGAEPPLHTFQTSLMDTFLNTISTIL